MLVQMRAWDPYLPLVMHILVGRSPTSIPFANQDNSIACEVCPHGLCPCIYHTKQLGHFASISITALECILLHENPMLSGYAYVSHLPRKWFSSSNLYNFHTKHHIAFSSGTPLISLCHLSILICWFGRMGLHLSSKTAPPSLRETLVTH